MVKIVATQHAFNMWGKGSSTSGFSTALKLQILEPLPNFTQEKVYSFLNQLNCLYQPITFSLTLLPSSSSVDSIIDLMYAVSIKEEFKIILALLLITSSLIMNFSTRACRKKKIVDFQVLPATLLISSPGTSNRSSSCICRSNLHKTDTNQTFEISKLLT